MHLKLYFLMVLAILFGVFFPTNPDKPSTLKISGFRHGLITFDSNQQPRIYKETYVFPYEVNGTCVAAGKKIPCQWYGFEFSYESLEKTTVCDCITISNRPQTQVYPGAVIAKETHILRWGFTLKGRSGHYLRPQYTSNLGGKLLQMDTICRHKGQEILKWQKIIFPPPY